MSYICWVRRAGAPQFAARRRHYPGGKEAQPEAYIVGEHFGDARQWLQADVEDAAMNYRGFTFPLWGFLANTDIAYEPQHIDARTCIAWMDNYRAGLSHQQQLRMFNQLDSHDTARFKTLLGKDAARLPLAVVWLFTWPGVPCIYYGDEVGVDGANDPMCRKPFPWDERKQDGTCWRCTSVWRNCVSAVWRCVVADARRCMPKVT